MPKQVVETKFFCFTQNNSGGRFASPAIYVIVEAVSAEDANRRAEDAGIDFSAPYCPCCGERWSAQWSGEKGDARPEIYGKSVPQYVTESGASHDWSTKDVPLVMIYHFDGRKEFVRTK